MSLFPNSKNVRVTSGNFQMVAGDQNINLNVHRDDPVQRWRTCVEIFDIVDTGNHYGIDYEISRVKLEVERIRLLEWGNAVGFGIASDQTASKLDSRLERNEIRGTVLRLLGCVYHVFDKAERLQEQYGLRPITATQDESYELRVLPLGSIFKRAYEPLLKLSKDRQHNTPSSQRKIWAIRDKKKFLLFLPFLSLKLINSDTTNYPSLPTISHPGIRRITPNKFIIFDPHHGFSKLDAQQAFPCDRTI